MVVFRKIYKKYIKKPVDDVDQNEKLLGKIVTVIDETNTINITYSTNVVAFAPVLMTGVKGYYQMQENGEYVNAIENVFPTTIEGTKGYMFKAENGANQTFVLRIKISDEQYTDYTFNLNYVG